LAAKLVVSREVNLMLKLYYTPISLNSRRVWVALLEKQIAFEPHSTSTATSKFLQPAEAGFVCIGAISIARNPDRPQSRSPASDRPQSRSPFRSRCQSPLRHIHKKFGFFYLKFPLS
jgi:hypothetical protein